MQREPVANFERKRIDTNDGIPFETCDPKGAVGIQDAMYSTAVRDRENANGAAGIRINLYNSTVLGLVRSGQTANRATVCAHPQVAPSEAHAASVRRFGIEFLQHGAGLPI